jgi:hypothetical protein
MTIQGDKPYVEPVYLTTEELAHRWRTAGSSIRDMRSRGIGPVGVKFGKKVLYDLAEVERYEAQQRVVEQKRLQRIQAVAS